MLQYFYSEYKMATNILCCPRKNLEGPPPFIHRMTAYTVPPPGVTVIVCPSPKKNPWDPKEYENLTFSPISSEKTPEAARRPKIAPHAPERLRSEAHEPPLIIRRAGRVLFPEEHTGLAPPSAEKRFRRTCSAEGCKEGCECF